MSLVSRKTVFTIATLILVAVAFTGCFRTASTADTASKAPLPTYTEGGTITLQMNGAPVTVQITDALFNNTDEGYPDYVELSGPQTYIIAKVENKIHDGDDGLSDYKPIVNQPLPVGQMMDSQTLTVNIPNAGVYPITGGTFTLTKYDHGMEGRVMWEGDIRLDVQSATGPGSLPGTFKIGMVPVW